MAAPALAFQTLYSPDNPNSNCAHRLPFFETDHDVPCGECRKSVILQVEPSRLPYRSTGHSARDTQRSTLSPASNATILPRRGTRFTRRLNAVSTASKSL